MKKYILILLFTLLSGCISSVGGYIGKYRCSSFTGWCSNGPIVLGYFWDFPEDIKSQYIRPDGSSTLDKSQAYWKAMEKVMSQCGLAASKAIGEQEITKEKEQCLVENGLERNSRKLPSKY